MGVISVADVFTGALEVGAVPADEVTGVVIVVVVVQGRAVDRDSLADGVTLTEYVTVMVVVPVVGSIDEEDAGNLEDEEAGTADDIEGFALVDETAEVEAWTELGVTLGSVNDDEEATPAEDVITTGGTDDVVGTTELVPGTVRY